MKTYPEFPKMARLSRQMVVTEKIDGTNGLIEILETSFQSGDILRDKKQVIAYNEERDLYMFAGSRTEYITPKADKHNFAVWVQAHADELWALGPGQHHGEWWGSGIGRRYGLPSGEKRFSLFNTARWSDNRNVEKYPTPRPACCHVTPVLYEGLFDTAKVDEILLDLKTNGSKAAPGFMNPEGVIVYHVASGVAFKKTLDKNDQHKGV